jgi:HEAT repeat protein
MQLTSVLFAASLLLAQAPQSTSDAHADQRAQARARYVKVENELGRASLENLSPEQREARARLLEVLDAYVQRADFGVQSIDPLARLPQFVDRDGRRCAIAELLHATGEDALVASVAAQHNTAWIVDLSADPRFLGWLDTHGLALDEAARIQGPPMVSPPAPVTQGGGLLGDVVPPPGSGGGPLSPGGGPSARPGPSSPRGPLTGPGAGPGAPGGGGMGPRSPGGEEFIAYALTQGDTGWRVWWEYNKLEFLRPNRFELDTGRDDAPGRTFTSQLDFTRRVSSPPLVEALRHRDARIRAAAASALGRFGGPDVVELLQPLLSDTTLAVRDAALLGLGASGRAGAGELLFDLAVDGEARGVQDLGQRGRALAIVALGLCRKAGLDASYDTKLVELVRASAGRLNEELGVAAMTYAQFSPAPELLVLARELAFDGAQSWPVRSRAIEALQHARDATTLGQLQHLLSGSQMELRRSAALALGEYDHDLVVAGLLTAHDLEKESMTRSYTLVSLGRQGGVKARERLVDALDSSDGAERAWAALGLGILAREAGDPSLASELAPALKRVKLVGERPAYWLALGLARADGAFEVLSRELVDAKDPQARMYAAQALALLGGERAHSILRERLAAERSDLARSQIALALGVLGRREDVEAIAKSLAGLGDPMLQRQVASALAFHGTSDALVRLGAMLADEKLDAAVRASAIDGLGMLLGKTPPLALAATARSSNPTLQPPWLREIYGTTF